MSENLPRLYFRSNNKYGLLPEWAYFFMRLGHQIANMPHDSNRFVIGLAIPTRAFACGFVATGIVLAKTDSEYSVDARQLEYIRSLKPGTPVYIRLDDNRKYPGVVTRFMTYNNKETIVICLGHAEEQGFQLNRYASRITVSDREVSLPRYKQKGYQTEKPSEFLQCCLGEKLVQKHNLSCSFEALLIGTKNVIENEVSVNSFYCKVPDESDSFSSGNLQEILRVRQFFSANKSYHAQCISSSNITPEKDFGIQTPPIVVYDGAISYIKLGHKWQSAHQIVLLDRTERQFSDAIELLNQNYTYRLAGSFKFPIRIPDGIEMMIYRDSIQ